MTEQPFRRDNHYVPHLYLKRWASAHKRVWVYRTLVSHPRVHLWSESSIRGVAYHQHLYTRIVGAHETDEIERWLDQEFEAPAEAALQKVISDARLTPANWKSLVRFLAAQHVRTPARLADEMQRWSTSLPGLLEDTMHKSVQRLEQARKSGELLPRSEVPHGEYIPFRATTQLEPGEEYGTLKGEIVAGRGLWLFSIRHLLTKTINALHQHKWTILSPPKGMLWLTSDDPVIPLNFNSSGDYDFKGGWGSIGTEILLPLGPRHLLYTQIGKPVPRRGEMFPRDQAELIQRFIAEHAHRIIFAAEPDAEVPRLRPRIVSADLVREESEQWRKWHEEQASAERKLMGLNKPSKVPSEP